MQMIRDVCTLMLSVVLHKVHFHPVAYVDVDSLADFHLAHIPQLPKLALKPNY